MSKFFLIIIFCITAVVACNNSGRSTPPPGTQAPPSAYLGANNYLAGELDPYVALNEYGTWVTIGSDRYFAPKGVAQEWAPYQNGYWSFDQDLGWSFVSQDDWGWMTEHYGIWRHHEKHGWIWFPFKDRHYEPSVVTWFNDGDYVGWYPFAERFASYYGVGLGFNDGFWGGYKSVLALGGPGGFIMGISLVNSDDVLRPNIFKFVIRDNPNLVTTIAMRAHSEERIHQGLVGPHPGGSLAKSFDFIQSHSHFQAPVGRTQTVTSKGGAKIQQPFIPEKGHPSAATPHTKETPSSAPKQNHSTGMTTPTIPQRETQKDVEPSQPRQKSKPASPKAETKQEPKPEAKDHNEDSIPRKRFQFKAVDSMKPSANPDDSNRLEPQNQQRPPNEAGTRRN